MLKVRDLGRMAYATALAIQRETAERIIASENEPNTLLLVEHDPVITVSQRRESAKHLLAPHEVLHTLGIDVQPTDRGGDITYHGPGQLVAYPILRLDDFGLNLSRYMRLLEQVVIDTLATFGVEGFREAGVTGVWVHSPEKCAKPQPPEAAKICALGVRIRRGVTMHGLALNVTTDLSHFQTIVPCGLVGRAVTSLAALGVAVSMDEVKSRLVEPFERALASVPTESR
jgi:lipoyl(octanoyl) transferase